MLNRNRSPRSGCAHDEVESTPGTGVYGLDRAICRTCGQIFVAHVDRAGPGALFKSRGEGAMAVGEDADDTHRLEHA